MALSKIDSDGIVANGITADSLNIGQIGGRRNLIINGAMQVAQRGTSFTGLTDGTGKYTLDRWEWSESGSPNHVMSVTQSTDAPDGFSNSIKIETTTGAPYNIDNERTRPQYKWEGQDLQHLAWGTPDAKEVTLSFWVKSNEVGIYTCHLYAQDANRIAVAQYTVNSSATWEYKTITFPANTVDTLPNDNTLALTLAMYVAVSPSYASGTYTTDWQAWNASNSGAGQTASISDTTGLYWQATGVQLEVGSVATPFEHRSFGEELALCQRYYEKSFPYGIAPGSYGRSVHTTAFSDGNAPGTLFKVTKRAEPTIVLRGQNSATVAKVDNNAGQKSASAENVTDSQVSYIYISSGAVGGSYVRYNFEADAEL